MSRPSHKEKLLTDGLRIVHQRGLGASSVRDIAQAAGVPQGSFTNHFASKEAFGLEILERYWEMTSANVRATLRNDGLPPLRRLRAWVDNQLEYPTRRLEELPSAPDAFDGWLGAIFHPRLPSDQMAYDS